MSSKRGTVTDFDQQVGLGTVTDDAGTAWPFHCIAIADGSRTIEIGRTVTFESLPKLGRWEATDIRPG
ncbi:MAG: hypothetical protein JWN99_968 [Ilumatobacteraceae bacterium]|nr:hypothetical protein [Ilumatobacteraceae bacterium]